MGDKWAKRPDMKITIDRDEHGNYVLSSSTKGEIRTEKRRVVNFILDDWLSWQNKVLQEIKEQENQG